MFVEARRLEVAVPTGRPFSYNTCAWSLPAPHLLRVFEGEVVFPGCSQTIYNFCNNLRLVACPYLPMAAAVPPSKTVTGVSFLAPCVGLPLIYLVPLTF